MPKVGKQNLQFKGVGEVTGKYLSDLRYNAHRRKIKFNITAEDIWKKYLLQKKVCALSGKRVKFGTSRKKGQHLRPYQTASVDRIDSSKGYTVANIQIVHVKINKMKMQLSDAQFISLCKQVAKHSNEKTSRRRRSRS